MASQDFMTMLNERKQALFGETAEIVYTYAELKTSDPRWQVLVACQGDSQNLGTGTGQTKEEAKKNGAQAALEYLSKSYADDIEEMD
ncbi:hypothetical protein H1R20_g2404, partial [Candolleomyces eurysporus]